MDPERGGAMEGGDQAKQAKSKRDRNHTPLDMIRDPKRRRHLAKYYNYLSIVERTAKHSNQTSDTELRKLLDQYGMLDEGEVGSYRLFEENTKSGEWPVYGIYNTMRAPPGQHWFCCYKGRKYDPLGKDASRTQEQPDAADNCGQRCVAYLLMCKRTKAPIGVDL